MSFGLIPTGFNRMRLPDIKAALEADVRETFGDVVLSPDSVFGQIIGVIAKSMADQWEAIEAAYNAMYPSTASGVSLDNCAGLVGITRLDATKTELVVWLTGVDGSVIPANSQVRIPETGDVFDIVNTTVITRTAALRARLLFDTQAPGTYTVRINQDAATVVYTTGDLQALVIAAINALDHPVTATADADDILLAADDDETPFNVQLSAQFSIQDIATATEARANLTGAVEAPAGTVDEIVTPVSGWDSVTNPLDGITGRAVETDVELRLRRRRSLRVIGAASVDAIRARLLQTIESIQSVAIFENRTPEEDEDGRPPHSFETVVQGGDDTDIAAALWALKPAGIETFGNVTEIITDSQGDQQAISFSRPVEVPIDVDVTIQVDDTLFPALGAQAVRDAIVEYGNTLSVGQDVSVQRFFCAIFTFPGVLAIEMQVKRVSEGSGWTSSVLPIGKVEIATFDADNVLVDPTTSPL